MSTRPQLFPSRSGFQLALLPFSATVWWISCPHPISISPSSFFPLHLNLVDTFTFSRLQPLSHRVTYSDSDQTLYPCYLNPQESFAFELKRFPPVPTLFILGSRKLLSMVVLLLWNRYSHRTFVVTRFSPSSPPSLPRIMLPFSQLSVIAWCISMMYLSITLWHHSTTSQASECSMAAFVVW